jgi:tRNA1(Val) A37 N6-methylase TrmN6
VGLSVLKENPLGLVTGLDIQADYCDLAIHNAALNNLNNRFTAIQGDIAFIQTVFDINSFDYVLTNPPFYETTAGRNPTDAGKTLAHHGTVDLQTWIRKALYPLKNKGYLMMICRTDRLGDIYAALHNRAGNIHLYPLVTGKTNHAKRIIVSCQKASKGGTKIFPPSLTHVS